MQQIALKKYAVPHSVQEPSAISPAFLAESSFFCDCSTDWIFSRTFPDIKKVNINLAFTKYSILGGIALEF